VFAAADVTAMGKRVRSAVRRSWLTMLLAATLAGAVPTVASMAGAAAAAPSPGAYEVGGAPTTTRLGAERAAVPHRRPIERRAARDPKPTASSPKHTGWDRATLLVHVPGRGLAAHARPSGASSVIGSVAGASKYYRVPIVLWVSAHHHGWGRVELPYVWPRRTGWIRLAGLRRDRTFVHVDVDLSAHRVRVYKHDELRYTAPGATGSPSSPTPTGHYVVTDRVPFPSGGYLGTFAFGISGIQPHLPAGWSGGNQLAIHGTNAPSSIGTSASAGCIRVSEATLAFLKPLLRLGTPVVIHA
jgi:lipoprotein-anchoring transpeptidase ErfK/SrfK